MSNVWDSFDAGDQWGTAEGGRIRNARAYRSGGLPAVADAAGQTGDLQTVQNTDQITQGRQRFADDRLNAAYDHMEKIAPWARNVVRATRGMDPARAQEFLNQPQNRQRFLDWGFKPEQVDAGIAGLTNPDPTVRQQWQDQLDAAFSQHQDPHWQVSDQTGEAYAIDPNTGSVQTGGEAPGAAQIQQGTNLDLQIKRRTANQPYAQPGQGGTQYRPMTPEEAAAYNITDPQNYVMGSNGHPEPIRQQRQNYFPDTAAQAANYAHRMNAAQDTLTRLESVPGFSPASNYAWGGGDANAQSYRQAQREFINAILRKESGAAISPAEFDSARQQYFPVPGDPPAQIEQKRAARQRALDGMINQSQGAYQEWFGGGAPPPRPGAATPQQPRPQANASAAPQASTFVRDAQGNIVPAGH